MHAQKGSLQQVVGVDGAAKGAAEERVQPWRPPFKQELEGAQVPGRVFEHELFVFQTGTLCGVDAVATEKVPPGVVMERMRPWARNGVGPPE